MLYVIIAILTALVIALLVNRRSNLKKIEAMTTLGDQKAIADYMKGWEVGYAQGRTDGIRAERIGAIGRTHMPDSFDQV